MAFSTSDYVTIGAAIVGAVIGICGAIWIAKSQRHKKAVFDASNKFKSVLTEDLPNYESDETTFSACILGHYPKHNAELKQLFIYLPESKKGSIAKVWETYTQLYEDIEALGVFGAVAAELPHPDFEPSLENVRSIERKRKSQVVKVINEIQKML